MSVAGAVWCIHCGAPPDVAISIERNGVIAHYGACFAHIEQVAARVRSDHCELPAPEPADVIEVSSR